VENLVHENGYSQEKSGKMTDMLALQQGKADEELADYIRRFCKRKWNSEFSREMSRSCTEMVKDWCK
jgi:nitroreductase/FMN reductase (NADPH)/FMN reductase [NAD(P)H]